MTSQAFTVTISGERVQDLRELIAELNKDPSGLIERARVVGYHRERMWLQPNADGSAQFIVYLELDEGVDPDTLLARLRAYESDFTRWFNDRYMSFLPWTPPRGEMLFSWDES